MKFFKRMLTLTLLLGLHGPMTASADEALPPPFFMGEKVTYAIVKLGVKAGEASLEFREGEIINGHKTWLVVFTSQGMNFFDEEKIFIDAATFFPVRVDRDLNIFGKKEKITEDYSSKPGSVRITKHAKGKASTQDIKRTGTLDNIYAFIYRCRLQNRFKIGDTFNMTLPTQDVALNLVKKHSLKAGGKVFDAFFFESKPRKYRVWFDVGERKIPLRIDGAVGFGNTSMVMKVYQERGEP